MIVNKETTNIKNAQLFSEQSHSFDNRMEEDRRRKPSEGYTYISSVGWIDRREKLRRKDEPYSR